MPDTRRPPARSPVGSLVLIAAIVGGSAAAFAYTGGWLSPDRLSPQKLLTAMAPPTGAVPGHRRNHSKGICFTGSFEANGQGAQLSRAPMLAAGRYPVVGRFNYGTPDPNADDKTSRVRGIGLQITAPDGSQWRSAMISPPFFPVSTPDAFYALLTASGSKDPDAMKGFAAAHPEIANFGAWAKSAPWTPSYAENRFNGLNSFIFTDASGTDRTVRWSLIPAAAAESIAPDDLAKRGPNALEDEIMQRVAAGPQRWTLSVQVANPGDPTVDPSKAWPDDRRTVEVGTLVADKIEPEPDGPCRDINYDPTILPSGMRTSDDPFPAARSAAYRVSFDRRTAEAKDYPRTAPEAKP
ncbi:catalase family peroxidase [Lichenihabitans sp. Uapishka_5]|uniref:catalase family peroxidase n=1 Tax=Lichenihabitans sp. Uapishka_5 TaxID=3037302 RepID=UPI0029E7FEBE|nr:catalase family peroxidase [Lichenihabitans sp. Uapishka_5]MDX7950467.1 catalase family peroxidase [Lichenihabitans sp. Uapishka_5]